VESIAIEGVDYARLGPTPPALPKLIIHPLGPLFRHLPLSMRRHLLFLHASGRIGNFRNPKSYTEKMQWRILNDRRPRLAWTADKLAQRDYAIELKERHAELQELHIPETYWVGTTIEDLRARASDLPHRFVIKPNHSSGRLIAVDTTQGALDWSSVAQIADAWVARDEEELVLGHWPYGQARHLLLAEERIGDGSVPSSEMRGWVFDGRLQQITRFDVGLRSAANYSRDFSRYDSGRTLDAPLVQRNPFDELQPHQKESLVTMMERLAEPFDHMRVDVFIDGGRFWFNELSPFAFGGLAKYRDQATDRARGEFWTLPDLSRPDADAPRWEALLRRPVRGTRQ
jgi:hypothetical protein